MYPSHFDPVHHDTLLYILLDETLQLFQAVSEPKRNLLLLSYQIREKEESDFISISLQHQEKDKEISRFNNTQSSIVRSQHKGNK